MAKDNLEKRVKKSVLKIEKSVFVADILAGPASREELHTVAKSPRQLMRLYNLSRQFELFFTGASGMQHVSKLKKVAHEDR